MNAALFLIAALALTAPALGKTFNRCSLAKEMARLGVPRSELPQWTCIAQHESSYRTGVVGPTNSNGYKKIGIFQLNNNHWCQPASGLFSNNKCKLSCNSLLTDDITASVRCAQQVKRQQGFTAWSSWKYCKGPLPSVNNCF